LPCNKVEHHVRIGTSNPALTYKNGRCFVARTDAWRFNDADLFRVSFRQQCKPQGFCACELARQRRADANGDRRWPVVQILDTIEMGVERRHFLDLRHGQIHPLRQSPTMGGRKATEMILQKVKIFDQSIGHTP
jgi:hypothetical protein